MHGLVVRDRVVVYLGSSTSIYESHRQQIRILDAKKQALVNWFCDLICHRLKAQVLAAMQACLKQRTEEQRHPDTI
jgi:hypothetical protein